MSPPAHVPFGPLNGVGKHTEGPFYPIIHQSDAPKYPSPPSSLTATHLAKWLFAFLKLQGAVATVIPVQI